nr:hypothetical protein [Tanacetum cinerariifolium]
WYEVDIGLDEGRDKPLHPTDMFLYSWDGGLNVCLDLTGSSPLTQTGTVDFVSGRAAIEVAQRKRVKYEANATEDAAAADLAVAGAALSRAEGVMRGGGAEGAVVGVGGGGGGCRDNDKLMVMRCVENTMFSGVHVVKQENLSDEDLSGEDSPRNLYITVKVTSQMNELDPYFRVRRDEPLKQLMIRWCARSDVGDYKSIRFIFDGKRINGKKTPDEIGIEDGDCIDAMMDQTSG